MSETTIALLIGLAIFLIPAGLFAWSALTKKGRSLYERGVSENQELPLWGGIIPLRPPKARFTRWATEHPSIGAFVFGIAAGFVAFIVHVVLLDTSVDDGIGRALINAIEYGIFARLFFGALHNHYGASTRGDP